jgi:hypothetical protein
MDNFKGDATELKFDAVGSSIFQVSHDSLDAFNTSCYDVSDFILMLYDANRIPFSERVGREAFVEFFKETLKQFPFIGTFDTYIFIIRAIFGEASYLSFDVPDPGKLQIDINASSSLEFEFMGSDSDGVFNICDTDGTDLIFRGLAGIETEYELELLFSEIMPAGIVPIINLDFYERYDFISWDEFGEYQMIDHIGNLIIFTEVGI